MTIPYIEKKVVEENINIEIPVGIQNYILGFLKIVPLLNDNLINSLLNHIDIYCGSWWMNNKCSKLENTEYNRQLIFNEFNKMIYTFCRSDKFLRISTQYFINTDNNKIEELDIKINFGWQTRTRIMTWKLRSREEIEEHHKIWNSAKIVYEGF